MSTTENQEQTWIEEYYTSVTPEGPPNLERQFGPWHKTGVRGEWRRSWLNYGMRGMDPMRLP